MLIVLIFFLLCPIYSNYFAFTAISYGLFDQVIGSVEYVTFSFFLSKITDQRQVKLSTYSTSSGIRNKKQEKGYDVC